MSPGLCARKASRRPSGDHAVFHRALQHPPSSDSWCAFDPSTPINQSVLDNKEEYARAVEEIPWGRFGKPEEVASLATFLASDEAEYVTGSTYYMDGGLTQQVTKY